MPSEQFFKLAKERQNEIIEAALNEFATHGYDSASTNQIILQAHMSKGALFKYFSDKEQLFAYVCRVIFDTMSGVFLQLPNVEHDDIFTHMSRMAVAKVEYFKKHPSVYRLLMQITKNPHHPVHAKVLADLLVDGKQVLADILTHMPPQNLRPGITIEMAVSAWMWIGDGLSQKYLDRFPDDLNSERMDDITAVMMQEVEHYFDLLKYGIYQGGATP